jgi:hypothetical protein
MPIHVYQWYTKELLRANPNTTFVFGDNAMRVGRGGQALPCRDEPNTLGVATKISPQTYMSDTPECFRIIETDMQRLIALLRAELKVGYPLDGIGTGLADLRVKAPKIFRWLTATEEILMKLYKVEGDSWI